MSRFETAHLSPEPDAIAPDGSEVRVLLSLDGGSMAHFELASGDASIAVVHRTVEEIWYFLGGRGQMWRSLDGAEETVEVHAGVCLTIPVGTRFQFRAFEGEPLKAVGVTMPRWPGEGEARTTEGPWTPTVRGPSG